MTDSQHSKHTGLEKAISQVEKAIKRSRTNVDGVDQTQVQTLEDLVQTSKTTLEQRQSSPQSIKYASPRHDARSANGQMLRRHDDGMASSTSLERQADTVEAAVSSADNPLELLALASTIPPPDQSKSIGRYNGSLNAVRDSSYIETQTFFKPLTSKLDTAADLDPVHLGLVTENEAYRLFDFFHNDLAHTRWGLDPVIHTAAFVRSRSCFLFTSVMAASALFLSETSALATRLHNHVKLLANKIVTNRYRSTEIVLAFMINIPWMTPGRSWAADDETCFYISTALTIALDLLLDRIIVPSSTSRISVDLENLPKADTINTERALSLEALIDVDPKSELAMRLTRNRERVWLALFNLERGVCLARGRHPMAPVSLLVKMCDTWHISDIADKQDGPLVAATVLRRDYAQLVHNIRETCDTCQLTIGHDATTIRMMRDNIETFFESWNNTWHAQVQQSDGRLPPYVEILASHTKLSAYCAVVNHPTAPSDVRHFFRTAGMASAINVLRTAVQAQTRLTSMPNNTVIMVTFAACFVLQLDKQYPGSSLMHAANARLLIGHVADVLVRIGSHPPHRNGASVLFGKHIKSILLQSVHIQEANSSTDPLSNIRTTPSAILDNTAARNHVIDGSHHDATNNMIDTGSASLEETDLLPVNMTNDQIIAAITNSEDQLETENTPWEYDENQFLDWIMS